MGDVPGARAFQRRIARPMRHAEPIATQGHGGGVELPFLGSASRYRSRWDEAGDSRVSRGRDRPIGQGAQVLGIFLDCVAEFHAFNAGSRAALPLGTITRR